MKDLLVLAGIAGVGLLLFLLPQNKQVTGKVPTESKPTEIPRNTHFVFAKILDTVLPIERGDKYEDPLDAMLHEQKLGEVTGGGTMQRKDKSIEFVGVDIELVNLDSALNATKAKLRELGA